MVLKLKQGSRLALLMSISALMLGGCTHPPLPEIDPVLLASDATMVLGDASITVPVVAISSWTEQGDLVIQQSPADIVSLSFSVYGFAGEMGKSLEICPLLTRQWSRSICRSSYTPLLQSLPHRVELVTPAGLSGLRNNSLGGTNQTKFDVVSMIDFDSDRPGRACSNPTEPGYFTGAKGGYSYCWAGYQLSNGLLAIWEGRQDDDVKTAEMIEIFVKNALGPKENFALVESAAIERRRSNAPCLQGQPYEPEIMVRIKGSDASAKCVSP